MEQEVHCLCETGPGRYEWLCWKDPGGSHTFPMIGIVAIDDGNERASIRERHSRSCCCFSTKPSAKRLPEFSDSASDDPFTAPMWDERNSNRVPDSSALPALLSETRNSRSFSRMSSSGVVPCFRASSRRGPSISGGRVIVVMIASHGIIASIGNVGYSGCQRVSGITAGGPLLVVPSHLADMLRDVIYVCSQPVLQSDSPTFGVHTVILP
jgi:hypothetical protein